MSGGALSAVLATGLMLGRVSAEVALLIEGSRCPARLPEGPLRLHLRLLEPVSSEGGRALVEPLGAGCSGPVSASWPVGQPIDAGYETVAEGRWIPARGPAGRPDGTLAVRSTGRPSGTPSRGARLRTALAGESRALYGARAPLVDALMLGRRGGIDPIAPAAVRGSRPGPPALDLRLPRRTDHRLGLSRRASASARPVTRLHPFGDGEHSLRGVPRLAGSGVARGGARGRRGALPCSATTRRCRFGACPRPASWCSSSIPGPFSTSVVGSPPRRCGARRASAGGAIGHWGRDSYGAHWAARLARRLPRLRSRPRYSAPSRSRGSRSTSSPSLWQRWRYRACWRAFWSIRFRSASREHSPPAPDWRCI